MANKQVKVAQGYNRIENNFENLPAGIYSMGVISGRHIVTGRVIIK